MAGVLYSAGDAYYSRASDDTFFFFFLGGGGGGGVYISVYQIFRNCQCLND